MKQFDLYDILGFLAPGTVTILGLLYYFPGRFAPLAAEKVSVGELGVFVLLAYIAGNVIAGVGSVLTGLKFFGPFPTDQVKANDGKIISEAEYTELEVTLRAKKLLKAGDTIKDLSGREWYAATRRIHSYLDARGLAQRVEMFNAKFALNQNLVVAFLLIVAISLYKVGLSDWKVPVAIIVCAIWSYVRAVEFGRVYAKTLVRTFLTAPEKPPSKQAGDDDD